MYRKPVPLNESHLVEGFDSGVYAIDDWLKNLALHNQVQNYTRTLVVTDDEMRVLGYHALCTACIQQTEQPKSMRSQGQPRQIPVALLARMGVHKDHQGKGLGGALLKSALMISASAGQHIAFRGVLVHAIDEKAHSFYQHLGFSPLPKNDNSLIISTNDILASMRTED